MDLFYEFLLWEVRLPCGEYLLIIGIVLTTVDYGCVLVTFDFLLLDQAFFLLANLIKQNACWFGIMNSAVQVFPVSPIVICCSLIVFRSLLIMKCQCVFKSCCPCFVLWDRTDTTSFLFCLFWKYAHAQSELWISAPWQCRPLSSQTVLAWFWIEQ